MPEPIDILRVNKINEHHVPPLTISPRDRESLLRVTGSSRSPSSSPLPDNDLDSDHLYADLAGSQGNIIRAQDEIGLPPTQDAAARARRKSKLRTVSLPSKRIAELLVMAPPPVSPRSQIEKAYSTPAAPVSVVEEQAEALGHDAAPLREESSL